VPHKNAEAIYDKIDLILSQKELQKTITTNGKKDVEKLFSLEKMIGSLSKLYAAS
jgi:glycosyltransferase involved in cell wall biosynthesis